MKKVFMMARMALLILCLAMVFTSPLSANADYDDKNMDQGYVKLPDDLDYIRNEVLSGISKTKARLQEEVKLTSNVVSIKKNVLVNRLDDEKILTEDDHELVLIYQEQYTYEEEAAKSTITTDSKIDDSYWAYNNLVIKLSARMDYFTDWSYEEGGMYPRLIYKSTYSFYNSSIYEGMRLGIDSISWGAKQAGPPYPVGGYYVPLYDTGTETYTSTYSDTHVEYHNPSNWTLISEGLASGYGTVYADFEISCYYTPPHMGSFYVDTVKRQVKLGLSF